MPPQLEDGYTRLANEIMDALISVRIPGQQRQCLDFIIRKTYGFNKLEDAISNSQFCAATGLKKSHVSRAINGLIVKNIVTKKDNYKTPRYRFNKHYRTWKMLPKKVTVPQKGNFGDPKKVDTKDTITKERKTFLSDSVEVRLAMLLFSKILLRSPDHKEPNIQVWSKHIDYMIRLDKRNPQKVANVIGWVQGDQFWQNNVLSTEKLRKHYDTLVMRMDETPKRSAGEDRQLQKELALLGDVK